MDVTIHPPAPRRTWFTTLVGAAVALLGGLGSLFSLFALLLAIGKDYVTTPPEPLGIFLIFILPPGTLLAGMGLLLRHRWARWWIILLMAALVAVGVKGLLAPDHADFSYAPLPGAAADAARRVVFVQSVFCIAVGTLVLLGLVSRPVRREFLTTRKCEPPSVPSAPPPLERLAFPQDDSESWRVGHCGRDMMFYEERHGGNWRRIDIDGEMLTGRAHHVIYFASAETWQGYPEWARHRRDEIIARVKSRFHAPDYEYHGELSSPVTSSLPAPALPKQDGTILPMLAFLLTIAAAAFWFAAESVERGETRLPVKHHYASSVSRDEKPVLFWASVSLLTTVGAGSAAFAVWLVIGGLRRR